VKLTTYLLIRISTFSEPTCYLRLADRLYTLYVLQVKQRRSSFSKQHCMHNVVVQRRNVCNLDIRGNVKIRPLYPFWRQSLWMTWCRGEEFMLAAESEFWTTIPWTDDRSRIVGSSCSKVQNIDCWLRWCSSIYLWPLERWIMVRLKVVPLLNQLSTKP
jgi:hypothetical protein